MRWILGIGVGVVGVIAGCSGSGAEIGPSPTAASADAGAGAAADSSSSTATGATDASGASGAMVEIHIRTSATPISHVDGRAGQTPTSQRIGIKSLTLLRSPTDPLPLEVFDLGKTGVDTPLDDGSDTIVARVPARSLTAGTFTIASVGVSFVSYRVAARVHSPGYPAVDGFLSTTQAMSDGITLPGAAAPARQGDFRSVFSVGGSPVGTRDGNEVVPRVSNGAGIRLETTASDAFYVFPANVLVDPEVQRDVLVDFDMNVHEDFRWEDQNKPGYGAGVFDTTTLEYEPVRSFGANSVTITSRTR